MAERIGAQEVHRALAGRWPGVLIGLGIDDAYLVNRHGPCPACGGKDRFRFDDKDGRGTWFCNECGAGDGFKLLQITHGWSFSEALSAVKSSVGLSSADIPAASSVPKTESTLQVAKLTAKVRDMLRQTTTPEHVPACVDYLKQRFIWPLPDGCDLKAHVGLDCHRRTGGKSFTCEGRFPALVAKVRDSEGEVVTAHVTYIDDGKKAAVESPRKILSPVKGRNGLAVRLMPLKGETLGVAEGIETALAAWKLNPEVPVWACLNTSLLAKFVPPPEVHNVIVYADADSAGFKAAWTLREELDGRCMVDMRVPKQGDFADMLEAYMTDPNRG